MNDVDELLSGLRDIQEPLAPEGVSVLLIAANALLLIVVLAFLYLRWQHKREGWRREALKSISTARTLAPQAGLLKLAKLLRQVMHYRSGQSSELDGQAWLQQLDREFSTQWFSNDNGRVFGDALYARATDNTINLDLLCDRLSTLIKALPATKPRTATENS